MAMAAAAAAVEIEAEEHKDCSLARCSACMQLNPVPVEHTRKVGDLSQPFFAEFNPKHFLLSKFF